MRSLQWELGGGANDDDAISTGDHGRFEFRDLSRGREHDNLRSSDKFQNSNPPRLSVNVASSPLHPLPLGAAGLAVLGSK